MILMFEMKILVNLSYHIRQVEAEFVAHIGQHHSRGERHGDVVNNLHDNLKQFTIYYKIKIWTKITAKTMFGIKIV
jgi:hypothetical protein